MLIRRRNAACSIALMLMLALLSSCSVQKSSSKMEAQLDKEGESAANPQTVRGQQTPEKVSITVDYLTPVSGIKSPEIFIYKEKRRLYVIQSNVLVRDYPVALGAHPVGDKERGGDGRTPEGVFFICEKQAAANPPKSLALSYPGRSHAERAYFAGLLTPVEFRDILAANEKRSVPPWNTKLGGEIAIHSGGAHRDWTDGSIALYDSDMEELYQISLVGTPVTIRP